MCALSKWAHTIYVFISSYIYLDIGNGPSSLYSCSPHSVFSDSLCFTFMGAFVMNKLYELHFSR